MHQKKFALTFSEIGRQRKWLGLANIDVEGISSIPASRGIKLPEDCRKLAPLMPWLTPSLQRAAFGYQIMLKKMDLNYLRHLNFGEEFYFITHLRSDDKSRK